MATPQPQGAWQKGKPKAASHWGHGQNPVRGPGGAMTHGSQGSADTHVPRGGQTACHPAGLFQLLGWEQVPFSKAMQCHSFCFFFFFFPALWWRFLLKKDPEWSAGVLSSVSKCKEAGLCLLQTLCVLEKRPFGHDL